MVLLGEVYDRVFVVVVPLVPVLGKTTDKLSPAVALII
jgi:hypothetical protein